MFTTIANNKINRTLIKTEDKKSVQKTLTTAKAYDVAFGVGLMTLGLIGISAHLGTHQDLLSLSGGLSLGSVGLGAGYLLVTKYVVKKSQESIDKRFIDILATEGIFEALQAADDQKFDRETREPLKMGTVDFDHVLPTSYHSLNRDEDQDTASSNGDDFD